MNFEISLVVAGIFVVFVAGNEKDTTDYKTCGGVNNEKVVSLINATIDRLMDMRQPTWGWVNTPEVVLSIQLSAQNKFFGRQKALEQMNTEIEKDIDSMQIGKLALYVTAIKSSCKNPRNFGKRNLVTILINRITKQFKDNEGNSQVEPQDGYYQFGLALGALCVTNRSAPFWLLVELIQSQNSDGSFGSVHSVDDSAQILLSLQCESTKIKQQARRKYIKKSIEYLVSFLKTRITIDDKNTWIGNEFSSPASVLGMMETDESSLSWKCKDVMESLYKTIDSTQVEGGLSQRLPALSGISYLQLMNGWTCESGEPIPIDYQPKCEPTNPSSCNISTREAVTPQIIINVRLTIYTDRPQNKDSVPAANVIVSAQNGSSLYDVLVNAKNENLITFGSENTAWGQSITSMQGVPAQKEDREWWALVHGDTGSLLSLGASSYIPIDGEQIVFTIKTW